MVWGAAVEGIKVGDLNYDELCVQGKPKTLSSDCPLTAKCTVGKTDLKINLTIGKEKDKTHEVTFTIPVSDDFPKGNPKVGAVNAMKALAKMGVVETSPNSGPVITDLQSCSGVKGQWCMTTAYSITELTAEITDSFSILPRTAAVASAANGIDHPPKFCFNCGVKTLLSFDKEVTTSIHTDNLMFKWTDDKLTKCLTLPKDVVADRREFVDNIFDSKLFDSKDGSLKEALSIYLCAEPDKIIQIQKRNLSTSSRGISDILETLTKAHLTPELLDQVFIPLDKVTEDSPIGEGWLSVMKTDSISHIGIVAGKPERHDGVLYVPTLEGNTGYTNPNKFRNEDWKKEWKDVTFPNTKNEGLYPKERGISRKWFKGFVNPYLLRKSDGWFPAS